MTRTIDKIILIDLIDQSFRSNNNKRVSEQIVNILKKNGIPHFFSLGEKILPQIFLDFESLSTIGTYLTGKLISHSK